MVHLLIWGDYGVAGDDYEGPPVFDDDQYEEESVPVYDTDIEDVIEVEEGFVGKAGFGREEDNIEDVVVANDLCFSMIQTTLNVDFEEDINTKSHEGKSTLIKLEALQKMESLSLCPKPQQGGSHGGQGAPSDLYPGPGVPSTSTYQPQTFSQAPTSSTVRPLGQLQVPNSAGQPSYSQGFPSQPMVGYNGMLPVQQAQTGLPSTTLALSNNLPPQVLTAMMNQYQPLHWLKCLNKNKLYRQATSHLSRHFPASTANAAH
ncbi:hypothetical protein Tco_1175432 [Tanacetum coccineum]